MTWPIIWQFIKDVFDYFGYISTAVVILGSLYAVYLCLKGVFPVLIRLGNGLSKRKIAIFAKGDNRVSLSNLLHESRLFNKVNIMEIPDEASFGMAKNASIFIVYWPDWKDNIKDILSHKKESAALIVHSPRGAAPVPDEITSLFDKHRNVILNNFRGRLLNDVVTSMITTGYEKK